MSAAARAVTFLMGASLWASVIAIPGLLGAPGSARGVVLLGTLPLLLLTAGAIRCSQPVLLLAFPVSLVTPLAMAPKLVERHLARGLVFVLVASLLVAYLLGVSSLLTWNRIVPRERLRRLGDASGGLPSRWRRRVRLYAGLAVLASVFPVVLLYGANFSSENIQSLADLYPDRGEVMRVVLNLCALALWVGLFSAYFLAPLAQHRSGDRELLRELSALRRSATESPGPRFYLAVAYALLGMGLLMLLRYR